MSAQRKICIIKTKSKMTSSIGTNICFGLLYVVVLAKLSTGYSTYFPLTDVHFTLPVNDELLKTLQEKPPFLQVNAKFIQDIENDVNENRFHYEIDDTQNYLSINELNGEIRVEEKMKKLGTNVTITISANLITKPSIVARTSLKIVPQSVSMAESCKNFEQICFWDSAIYSVPENVLHGNLTIGAIGPNFYEKICPNLSVKYALLNGKQKQYEKILTVSQPSIQLATTYFAIESNILIANTRFDHESISPGPGIRANIKCMVRNDLKQLVAVHNKVLRVNVLDRNDNLPEMQDDEEVSIHLEDPHFRNGSQINKENIIFMDKDSIALNSNITYEVVNDTLDIIRPTCNAYENDYKGVKGTVVGCKLTFSRNGILRVSPYCFGLLAADKSVDLSHNFVFKSALARICLITDLEKIHEQDRPAAQALQSKMERNSRRNNKKDRKYVNTSEETSSESESVEKVKIRPTVKYPKQVAINKQFTHMARVAQPEDMSKIVESNYSFNITSDTSGAFGITEKGGIIFVRNVSAISNGTHSLTVAWKRSPPPNTAAIEILVTELGQNASKCKSAEKICSELENKKKCMETCGVGTQGEGCQWRPNNATLPVLSNKYATCSPNITTCPNKECDPLEELGESLGVLICPQDCTQHVIGAATSNGGIGIKGGVGLCTCDITGKCTCASHDFVGRDSPKKKSEAMVVPKVQSAQCGVPCIVLVILCPVTLTVVIICLVISRRKYVLKNRKQKEINASLNQRRETETETLTDPGVAPQNLYDLLTDGYRMDRPRNCSEEIYSIIKSCWALDPYGRPSFKVLATQWENLLGSSAKYLELDNSGISNPLYCVNIDEKNSANRT
ncbi:Proto-oncogene tyrosine-protein kinase receptor Ret, partial [Pseudolycoriella hygida]